MNVLLINGSSHAKGCTYTALSEVARQLEVHGVDTTLFNIGIHAGQGCIVCRKCAETGYCVFNDDGVNECVDMLRSADGVIIGSPVYYASPNGGLLAFLDRLFFLKSAAYGGKPAAAVVSCRRGGASATFDVLNKYFTIAGMPVVSSQYWNSVHGMTPEDVKKDEEGLQTMRTLANNMAWLLKCIDAGKKLGLTYPDREEWIPTNFIRA